MFTRAKLITILMTLSVLLSIHAFATNAFAVCSSCVSNTITCTANAILAGDPDSNWRWAFGDPQSGNGANCGTAVPTPTCSDNNNTYNYDTYTFTNNTGGASPDCFNVTLTNTSCAVSIGSAAFSGTFTGVGSHCANWLGDSGGGITTGSKTYSFSVANGATVTLVVTTSTNAQVCTGAGTYTIAISPCPDGATTAADGNISGTINAASQSSGLEGVIVFLSGSQTRKTITDAGGNYYFDNVDTNGFYTVSPSRVNYAFTPGQRSFSLVGNKTEALFDASANGGQANPIDTAEYFVRQHYLDFLGREPDESGFNFWSDQILDCNGNSACMERKAINVSAAYFFSIEFNETGGLVDAFYRTSFGRRPFYAEFIPDAGKVAKNVVVGRFGWQQQLSSNKQQFIENWVQRADFRAAYDLLTNDRYVDTLIANTGVNYDAGERDSLVMGLTLGSLSRADVLQQVAQDERFVQQKRNDMFVMMEYFGYLRRDPDATGFQYWLNKLNQFNGDFEKAEMVRSFLVSSEFRNRFPR